MDYGSHRIEPGIKPLVNILNEVPFIRTFSSCEGHFDKSELEHMAYVQFHATDAAELERFASEVLPGVLREMEDYAVEIHHRMYPVPGEDVIRKDFQVTIKPIIRNVPKNMKRESVDRGIAKLREAIRHYLEARS